MSIAVIADFKIHWAKAYGIEDAVTGVRVKAKALFQAASISKAVAALTVLKAVRDGRITMDDDINTVLKSWKLTEIPFTRDHIVTPRLLTSHAFRFERRVRIYWVSAVRFPHATTSKGQGTERHPSSWHHLGQGIQIGGDVLRRCTRELARSTLTTK